MHEALVRLRPARQLRPALKQGSGVQAINLLITTHEFGELLDFWRTRITEKLA